MANVQRRVSVLPTQNHDRDSSTEANQTMQQLRFGEGKDSTRFSSSVQSEKTDEGFSPWRALKKFTKGIISPLTVFVDHPVMAIGGLVAAVGACSLVPALVPLMTVGFGAYSLYQIASGGLKAFNRYQSGDKAGAENAFEDIGAGVIGTVLGALGVRASAAIVAEAKAAQAAIKAGLTAEQVAESSAMAASSVKDLTFFQALKENASIITSAEGRSALLGQLKPSAIGQKASEILGYFKSLFSGKSGAKAAVSEESPFVSSPEGQRRAKLSKADIQRDAEQVIAKAYDDMGIAPELRPKFTVHDELKYMDAVEIEGRVQSQVNNKRYAASEPFRAAKDTELPRVKVFEDGELPSQFTNEQIIEKAKAAMSKAYDEMGVPASQRSLDSVSFGDRQYLGGVYKEASHTIDMHANTYRQGYMTMEEVLAHEATHADQALLRMRLPASERAAIIQEELLNGVRYGETEKIILRGNFMGPETMSPPNMGTSGMRDKIATLIQEEVYPNVAHYGQDLRAAYSSGLKARVVGSAERVPYLDKSPIVQSLEGKLGAIVDQHSEFLAHYKGNKDAALHHLLEYMEAHTTRYQAYAKNGIEDARLLESLAKLPQLSPEKRAQAIQSIRHQIGCIEGNARQQGLFSPMFGDKAAFDQYQFTAEEVLARNTAARFEQKQIQAQLTQVDSATPVGKLNTQAYTARLAELDLELKRNEIGQQMYQLFTKSINQPDDKALAAELAKLKTLYEPLEAQMTAIRVKRHHHDPFKDSFSAFPLRNGALLRGGEQADSD